MKRRKVFGRILSAIGFACGIVILLLILGSFVFPLVLGVVLALFLGALVIYLVWCLYRQGFSGAITITMLSSGLLGLVAFVVAFEKPIPIGVLQFWLLVELGLIAFLIALSLLLLQDDYEELKRTARRCGELESYLMREKLEEKNTLIKAMSVSNLLALKDKHKSNKSFVQIIDDILEERE